MDENTKDAIKALIEMVDSLADSRRNISMAVLSGYPEIERLRRLIEKQ